MLKGMIFNILQGSLAEAVVLDICAGSGALGIEALSRGATRATFMEEDRRALTALEKNLQDCKLLAVSEVLAGDALRRLASWQPKQKVSLVFCDPPYHSDLYEPILTRLGSVGWLTPEAIIVVEHHKDTDISGVYGQLRSYRRVSYSRTAVTFLQIGLSSSRGES